jgi:hypothetical protein
MPPHQSSMETQTKCTLKHGLVRILSENVQTVNSLSLHSLRDQDLVPTNTQFKLWHSL